MRFLALRFLAAVSVAFASCGAALAQPVTYLVTVDTSSVAGQSGYLDTEFNGNGMATQLATATITNFATNGAINFNPADPNQGLYGPNASGSLAGPPNSLTFNNQSPSNGYTTGITFGTTLSFDLSFSGPALSNPDGTASGVYQLDFIDPTLTHFLLTNDPDGNTTSAFNVATVQVNPDGTLTPTTYPNLGGGPSAATLTPVPEPSSLAFLTLAGLGLSRWRSRRSCRAVTGPG